MQFMGLQEISWLFQISKAGNFYDKYINKVPNK
jgi:hypothetical protein